MAPEDNPFWSLFQEWAEKEGVDLEHEEDYDAWWKCWWNGFRHGERERYEFERSKRENEILGGEEKL